MKTYVSDQHIRLVGKAWEVRNRLRVLQKNHEAGVMMHDVLNQLVRVDSGYASITRKHNQPRSKRLQKI
ncbi:Z-ring formation inhibitor MciZ [Paenibacillus swuensis]|uniref:Z-ring formation inhibitor MciZ n=1 Tax=Paenibacillus swuensis TaxID=1178515 RepID=UPI0009EE5048|nr:Z-ring formation inhibitor MciZ [Paenibacillus swuensis]